MYSTHHALVSLVVGALALYVLPPIAIAGTELPTLALLAYAVAVGVFVDVDHVLIARARTGSWDALRFCLANPIAAVVDQDQIFATGDVGVLPRLLSHLLIVGVVVPLLALESAPLAVLTAVVLYVHLVCDVIWDIWQLQRRADRPAAERIQTIL